MASKERNETMSVLRAEYVDYCSARLADMLLRLTADDMYLLAEEVAGDAQRDPDELPSFNTIVQLATERLTMDLELPNYWEWVREHEKDPRRSERELTGLRRRGFGHPYAPEGGEERSLIPQKGRSSSSGGRLGAGDGDDCLGRCTGGGLPGLAPTSDPPPDPSMTISCTAMSVQYLVPP